MGRANGQGLAMPPLKTIPCQTPCPTGKQASNRVEPHKTTARRHYAPSYLCDRCTVEVAISYLAQGWGVICQPL